MGSTFATIDEYIASCPQEVQPILQDVRRTIRKVVPEAQEAIKYSMPTFTIDGRSVVHFAAWKHHVSIYPAPATDGEVERRLSRYRSGEATAKFPLNEPIPYDLITDIVELILDQAD